MSPTRPSPEEQPGRQSERRSPVHEDGPDAGRRELDELARPVRCPLCGTLLPGRAVGPAGLRTLQQLSRLGLGADDRPLLEPPARRPPESEDP